MSAEMPSREYLAWLLLLLHLHVLVPEKVNPFHVKLWEYRPQRCKRALAQNSHCCLGSMGISSPNLTPERNIHPFKDLNIEYLLCRKTSMI